MSRKLRLAILASGVGHTLQAVLDACAAGTLSAEVVLVISNNADSGALARARAAGVAALHMSGVTHPETLDAEMTAALQAARTDLVVLTGYMKKLGPELLSAFQGKIVNTHPSLLPKYGGQGMYDLRVHAAVLAGGDAETGVTVHYVEGDYDSGAVIAQTKVPVLPDDTAESLAERVKQAERPFLIENLQRMAEALQ